MQYIQLICADALLVYLLLIHVVPIELITSLRARALIAMNLLAAMAMRLAYQYMYEYNSINDRIHPYRSSFFSMSRKYL